MEDKDIVNLVKYEGQFAFHVKENVIESRVSFCRLFHDNAALFQNKLHDLELNSSIDNEEEMEEMFGLISKMENLHLLSLCGTPQLNGSLKTVPSSFGNLQNLSYLNMKQNPFKKIPDAIFDLTYLKRLDLSCCKIKFISQEIRKLKCLVELHIQKNELEVLPNEISELTKLERLNLSSNHIAQLPTDFHQLKKLKVLRISANCFRGIFHRQILKLKSIEVVHCGHNNIESIDEAFANLPNLRSLDISYNNIHSLPDKISKLPFLIKDGNPFNTLESKFDCLNFSETFEYQQELDTCQIEVDLKLRTRHILPSGVELHFAVAITKQPLTVSVSLNSGLQNSFKLNDAEQLLSDIVSLEPTGTSLDKPLTIKIPFHFKPVDQQTREVVIRCISHLHGEETVEDLSTLKCTDTLASCEVSHFSCFAVVSRLVQVSQTVTQDREELLFSPIHPETKLWFPKACVDDKAKITMQILEVDDNLITQATGNPLAVASHVVMVHVSPRATVFKHPVTVTMALPRQMIGNPNQQKLRLLKASCDSMDWMDVSETVDIEQHATNATFQMTSFSKLWLVTEIVCGVARRVYRRLITYQVQFIAMQLRTAPTLVMAQCLRHQHTEARVAQLKKAGYIGDDPATPMCDLMEGDQFKCRV